MDLLRRYFLKPGDGEFGALHEITLLQPRFNICEFSKK